MLVCHPSGALKIGEHLLLGASPGVGSSGERRKLLKELEVSSGSFILMGLWSLLQGTGVNCLP